MNRVVQAVLVLLILTGGFFAYRFLFPDDADVIRKQLGEMASEASFAGEESPLAKVSKAGKLAGFFTTDARISVKPWGARQVNLNGRAEIREATIGARSMLTSMRIEIERLDVKVAEDRGSAQVTMSLVVTSSRQDDPWYQSFDVTMKRVDGDWLVSQVRNRELIKQ